MTQIQEQVLQEGTHIGVYEIKDVISTNDYGITYHAWNQHLNMLVVVTEYFPRDLAIRHEGAATVRPKSKSSQDAYQYGLQEFIQHAEMLEETSHQNIVGVHNVLQFNETAYLVMDHEDGVSLSKSQDLSPAYSEDELKKLLRSLLNALQYFHEKGSVHGDIHPENILIRKNGEPVLINFSAARLAFAAHNNKLLHVLHTGYAPPELYEPGNLPGPAADLYALGATMYRCMTHSDPLPALERVKALKNNLPDPLQTNLETSAPVFNEQILKSITWMLHLNTSERPQSALEVLTLLDKNLEETQTMETADAQMDDDSKVNTFETTTAQSRISLIISSIGIVILVAAGFWYLKQDKKLETVALHTPEQTSVELNKEINKKAIPETAVPTPAKTGNLLPSEQPVPSNIASSEINTAETVTAPANDKVLPPKTESEAIPQLLDESTTELQPKSLVSSVIENDKNELIKQHLAIAEEHIEALRLSTPPENNAYQQYQDVLEMDPENVNAKKGLQRIVDLYIWFIESAIQGENNKRASIYLDRAEKILPDDPELQGLREELSTKEQ